MTRASRDAQRESAPSQRPFVVTRSGGAGLQRYAQTWSGDNYISWETLKYNLRMGLSFALCGVSNIGHDVGGFAGPKPDPELFLRWVRNFHASLRYPLLE
jgi:alpha-glucosidase